jgi:hypothetical protein
MKIGGCPIHALSSDEDFQIIHVVNCFCKLFFNHDAAHLRARGLGIFLRRIGVRERHGRRMELAAIHACKTMRAAAQRPAPTPQSQSSSAFGASVSTGVNLMTDQMPFSPKLVCLPIALVAFSMAFGAPAVRAQSDADAPSWREIAVDPIMNAVHTIEQRIAGIEATVALFAGSFTTQQLNTRQLCVSDETGAQTCVTKAQLDAVLAKMAHMADAELPPVMAPATVVEVPAEITEAPAIVTETYVSPITEPATIESDAKRSADIESATSETAVATASAIEGSGSKEEFAALFQPIPSEMTVVSVPESGANEGANSDQEPATTGSITSEPSHDALVSYPEVEIWYPDAASSNE